MIFSLKHKFLFIRNPACGNRSIAKALEPFADFADYFDLKKRGFGFKHCTYMNQLPTDIYNLSEMFDDDFFVFCGVRNPWERAYNIFEGQRILLGLGYMMDVIERDEITTNFDVKYTKMIAESKTLKEDLMNLPPDGRKALDQKPYRIGVDFVYRFENIEEDFEKICDILKIKTRLPPKEESYHGIDFKDETYREHYDQEMIDMISEVHKDDIEEYGYEF